MAAGVNDSERLVERGDHDELTIHVDRLCDAQDWDGLTDLRDRCRRALERGKQLWPIAAHAEYRVALEAPGPWAAVMLVPGAGRFALGPLSEVAASTHAWADLAPHAPAGPVASLTAHERVVRGEDLTGDDRVDERVLDLPLALAAWESAYTVADYRPHEAHFPHPRVPPLAPITLPASAGAEAAVDAADDDGEIRRALVALVHTWTTESNGRVEVAAVRGDAPDALARVGLHEARAAEVGSDLAVAHLAWAAASGGAHGRRSGMAPGRFAAWWAVAAVTGLLDDWPLPADVLGEAASELRWFLWDAGEPDTGWSLRVAVTDEHDGLAWAVAATDAKF